MCGERKVSDASDDATEAPAIKIDRRIVPFKSILIDDEEFFANARSAENETKDIKDFAARLAEKGLMNPLVVYEDEEKKLHLRVGFRRYRAIKILGWTEVEVKVLPPKTSVVDQHWANLEENALRLQLTQYEMACRATMMIEKFEITKQETARRMGLKYHVVVNYMRWLRMLPDVIKDEWKGEHPLLTNATLEEYSHMHPEEATLVWYECLGQSERKETFGDADEKLKKKPKRPRPSNWMLGVIHTFIANSSHLTPRERELAAQVCEFALGERRTIPGIYDPLKRKNAIRLQKIEDRAAKRQMPKHTPERPSRQKGKHAS